MDEIKNLKLSKVVSTKITDQEHKNLQRLAKYYQSRGYISKDKISEATRLLLRKSMKWELSIMNHQETMDNLVTQNYVRESRIPIKEKAQLLIDILNNNTKIHIPAPSTGSYNKSSAEGLLAESGNTISEARKALKYINNVIWHID